MTAQQIIDLLRDLTFTNSNQVSDAKMLNFVNIAYKELNAKINQDVNEDLNADVYTGDLATGQKEYSFPVEAGAIAGAENLLGVSVKYSDTGEFKKLRPSRISNLDFDESWYETNQPESDPFYIKFDTGVWIYPTPSQNVTGGLKIFATKEVNDLALTDTPVLDKAWHFTLAIGAKQYVYASRGLTNEKNDAINEYQAKYREVLNTLSDSELSPLIREIPTLYQFQ